MEQRGSFVIVFIANYTCLDLSVTLPSNICHISLYYYRFIFIFYLILTLCLYSHLIAVSKSNGVFQLRFFWNQVHLIPEAVDPRLSPTAWYSYPVQMNTAFGGIVTFCILYVLTRLSLTSSWKNTRWCDSINRYKIASSNTATRAKKPGDLSLSSAKYLYSTCPSTRLQYRTKRLIVAGNQSDWDSGSVELNKYISHPIKKFSSALMQYISHPASFMGWCIQSWLVDEFDAVLDCGRHQSSTSGPFLMIAFQEWCPLLPEVPPRRQTCLARPWTISPATYVWLCPFGSGFSLRWREESWNVAQK